MLALLGISAVATVVNTETLVSSELGNMDGFPNASLRGMERQIKIAEALERLAAGVRSGDLAAIELVTTSSLKADEWLQHSVTVRVEMLRDNVA
jgi:hypothetical protein